MSWQSNVVEHMRGLRANGTRDFEEAWRLALRAFPPRGRDMGPVTPTLLDDDGETVVAFFRRVADDAWHGRAPALQHFHPSLLLGDDGSEPAPRTERHRKLAA
jgi:hypothetical protein